MAPSAYRPIDWVGFFRPRLFGCLTKHYRSPAGKALPAIELGMVANLQQVGNRLFPCLLRITRSGDTAALLTAAQALQGKRDVLTADRQVKISHLHRAGVRFLVIRAAINFTACLPVSRAFFMGDIAHRAAKKRLTVAPNVPHL